MSILLEGFAQASQRFYDVMREREARTFWPLFEALAWTYSIDQRLQAAWKASGHADLWYDGFMHGDVAKGVRYARNRVHHQWADALWLSEGAAFPMQFPMGFYEWRWRPDLPSGRHDEFKPEYDDRVAASPARVTLGELSDCFGDAYGELWKR